MMRYEKMYALSKTAIIAINDNLNSIFENLPELVYWKDKNYLYQGCNKHVAELLHLNTPADIINKSDYDFGWTAERIKELHDVDKLVIEKGISQVDEDAIPVNGVMKIFLTSKTPLRNKQGEIIGILGISTDISERKQMEKELIKAKEEAEIAVAARINAESATMIAKIKADKEEEMRKTVMVLVGDIVHDLRTPIATIRTVTNTLSTVLPALWEVIEEAKELGSQKINLLNKKKLLYVMENRPIVALQGSVTMMDDFINSTLAELKNAQKTQEIELTPQDLTLCSSRRIIENTLDAYSPIPKQIKINQNISYDFFMKGNSILLMKILFNLIGNAIEQITLTGKGEITITTEDGGDKNLLKIKDTGGGAPPDVVANFFQGYFTTKKNGTGIGLAFSKRIMKIFGGDITFDTIYGDYMEFILSFPKVGEVAHFP